MGRELIEIKKITSARGAVCESLNGGASRNLLYLASGEDVGCSVGLFWEICDHFYLVDPALRVDYVKDFLTGKRPHDYVAGFYMDILKADETTEQDMPCTLLTVRPKIGGQEKFVYLVRGTTEQWLPKDQRDYKVVIQKDYQFEGAVKEFPYDFALKKLCMNGVYAETAEVFGAFDGKADFSKFRALGLVPKFRVDEESGNQIGFAGGYMVFQKVEVVNYADVLGAIEKIDKVITKLVILADMSFDSAYQEEQEGVILNLKKLVSDRGFVKWESAIKSESFYKFICDEAAVAYRASMIGVVDFFCERVEMSHWGKGGVILF